MSDSNQQTARTKQKPIDRVRIGKLNAAIWKVPAPDGSHVYSFTVDRYYKDEHGNVKNSGSFAFGDALKLGKLADRVDSRIRQLYEIDVHQAKVDELEKEPA